MKNFNPAVKWGAWMALIGIVIFLAIYAIDASIITTIGGSIAYAIITIMALPIVFMILGARDCKPNFTPFTFGKALASAMVVAITSALIVLVFQIIFTELIDPGYEEMIKELALDNTREMMENAGADDDAIEDAINRTEKGASRNMGVVGKLKGTLFGMIWYLVLGLIIAAVQKDKKNSSEDLIA